MTDPVGSWEDERGEIVAAQERARRAAADAETARARELIAAFLPRFREAGIAPIPLRAMRPGGRGTVRTDLTGWYLKPDRTVAIGEDGAFYVLRATGTLAERLRGATVAPSDPPLVIGRGGKDGESFDLEELLQRRLADPVLPGH